ncbi:hypothetical protein PIROE2DRAFT_1906 [Piromyces sp. E2]|nr:hypothetical protein PIROE2DRAFT_1906 [Piromyces sp. E2]|eukprot:OUM69969.1 hypothetical protein PIROE2DRAFT_1906 [Piromyces sp. E2]
MVTFNFITFSIPYLYKKVRQAVNPFSGRNKRKDDAKKERVFYDLSGELLFMVE